MSLCSALASEENLLWILPSYNYCYQYWSRLTTAVHWNQSSYIPWSHLKLEHSIVESSPLTWNSFICTGMLTQHRDSTWMLTQHRDKYERSPPPHGSETCTKQSGEVCAKITESEGREILSSVKFPLYPRGQRVWECIFYIWTDLTAEVSSLTWTSPDSFWFWCNLLGGDVVF